MVRLGSLLPYERILVRVGFDLRSIYILDFKADELRINQHLHDLSEDIIHNISQTMLPEQVDCVEVRTLHSAQPHEVDITLEQSFHLATGVDVLEICVKYDLQQHTRCKTARATTFICGLNCTDIKMLNYGIQDAYWVIFRDKVTDTVRKKEIIVLVVRFICYLYHVIEG